MEAGIEMDDADEDLGGDASVQKCSKEEDESKVKEDTLAEQKKDEDGIKQEQGTETKAGLAECSNDEDKSKVKEDALKESVVEHSTAKTAIERINVADLIKRR